MSLTGKQRTIYSESISIQQIKDNTRHLQNVHEHPSVTVPKSCNHLHTCTPAMWATHAHLPSPGCTGSLLHVLPRAAWVQEQHSTPLRPSPPLGAGWHSSLRGGCTLRPRQSLITRRPHGLPHKQSKSKPWTLQARKQSACLILSSGLWLIRS